MTQLFGGAAIPQRFEKASLDDFSPKVAAYARQALDERAGLLVRGEYGVGKTHLACGLLSEALRRTETGLFVTAPQLLLAIKATFGRKDGPTEQQILAAAGSVDWLVLDDLGVEVDTAWVQQQLYEVVNRRYVAQLPIVATTNEDLDALAVPERLGPRTTSRLREMCRTMRLTGKDRRLRQ